MAGVVLAAVEHVCKPGAGVVVLGGGVQRVLPARQSAARADAGVRAGAASHRRRGTAARLLPRRRIHSARVLAVVVRRLFGEQQRRLAALRHAAAHVVLEQRRLGPLVRRRPTSRQLKQHQPDEYPLSFVF